MKNRMNLKAKSAISYKSYQSTAKFMFLLAVVLFCLFTTNALADQNDTLYFAPIKPHGDEFKGCLALYGKDLDFILLPSTTKIANEWKSGDYGNLLKSFKSWLDSADDDRWRFEKGGLNVDSLMKDIKGISVRKIDNGIVFVNLQSILYPNLIDSIEKMEFPQDFIHGDWEPLANRIKLIQEFAQKISNLNKKYTIHKEQATPIFTFYNPDKFVAYAFSDTLASSYLQVDMNNDTVKVSHKHDSFGDSRSGKLTFYLKGANKQVDSKEHNMLSKTVEVDYYIPQPKSKMNYHSDPSRSKKSYIWSWISENIFVLSLILLLLGVLIAFIVFKKLVNLFKKIFKRYPKPHPDAKKTEDPLKKEIPKYVTNESVADELAFKDYDIHKLLGGEKAVSKKTRPDGLETEETSVMDKPITKQLFLDQMNEMTRYLSGRLDGIALSFRDDVKEIVDTAIRIGKGLNLQDKDWDTLDEFEQSRKSLAAVQHIYKIMQEFLNNFRRRFEVASQGEEHLNELALDYRRSQDGYKFEVWEKSLWRDFDKLIEENKIYRQVIDTMRRDMREIFREFYDLEEFSDYEKRLQGFRDRELVIDPDEHKKIIKRLRSIIMQQKPTLSPHSRFGINLLSIANKNIKFLIDRLRDSRKPNLLEDAENLFALLDMKSFKDNLAEQVQSKVIRNSSEQNEDLKNIKNFITGEFKKGTLAKVIQQCFRLRWDIRTELCLNYSSLERDSRKQLLEAEIICGNIFSILETLAATFSIHYHPITLGMTSNTHYMTTGPDDSVMPLEIYKGLKRKYPEGVVAVRRLGYMTLQDGSDKVEEMIPSEIPIIEGREEQTSEKIETAEE